MPLAVTPGTILEHLQRAMMPASAEWSNMTARAILKQAMAPINHIPGPLVDPDGRMMTYLRLSITDVCNFRCQYCLPDGYKGNGQKQFLDIDEIRRLLTACAELGMKKLRLTGGEATVRADFAEIAAMAAAIPGIRKLAFSTNGYRLHKHAAEWRRAGLSAVNVSVDSLDPATFHRVTGHDRLHEVLSGVEAAVAAGYEQVKINAVLLRDINDGQIDGFLEWVRDRPVEVRFIELMQTGDNLAYFRRHHVSADLLKQKLLTSGWRMQPRGDESAGPALEYRHPEYRGGIGIIAPYAQNFCNSCNRLRVTARGELRLCLFGTQGASLRELLQHDEQKSALAQKIIELLRYKRSSHFLARGNTGVTMHLASVGG
jgi:cyclic pyranopterin phosphate synthase